MRIQSLYDLHMSFPDIDGYWNTQNLDETERRIRSQLPNGDEVVNHVQIEVLTQAVRLLCLQHKMVDAKNFLNYAETLLKDLKTEENIRLHIRYFLEAGRFYSLCKYPARALELFRRAWELSFQNKKLDYLAIDAAYMISITLPVKQSKSWFKSALEMAVAAESNSLAARWKPYLYMQAGWQAYDLCEYESALKNFLQAQDLISTENVFMVRTLKWSSANTLRVLGRADEALKTQLEIFHELVSEGESNGYVYLELAECYQAIQDFENAAVYYERAFEKLKTNEWYSENFAHDLSEIQKKAKKIRYH